MADLTNPEQEKIDPNPSLLRVATSTNIAQPMVPYQ